MNAKILILLGLAALAAAGSVEPYGSREQSREYRDSRESYESGEAKYEFEWSVKDDSSGNDFGHQEARDGEHTQGSYYVHLPDGRLQKVDYQVDGDSGYIADVQYEGEARHPDSYESASVESYKPPRRYYDSKESK